MIRRKQTLNTKSKTKHANTLMKSFPKYGVSLYNRQILLNHLTFEFMNHIRSDRQSMCIDENMR